MKAVVIALIFQIFLHLRDAYDFQKARSLTVDMTRVTEALLLASLTLWGLYLVYPRILVGQGTFVRILVVGSVFRDRLARAGCAFISGFGRRVPTSWCWAPAIWPATWCARLSDGPSGYPVSAVSWGRSLSGSVSIVNRR